VKIKGWADKEAAHKEITSSVENYNKA